MAETKTRHFSSSEYSTIKRVLVGAVAVASLLKIGAAINENFDNDRIFQTGPPAGAEGPDSGPTSTTEASVDKDTVALHIQSDDTAYALARNLVGEDGEWRIVADRIMAASRKLGHAQLLPGDVLEIEMP